MKRLKKLFLAGLLVAGLVSLTTPQTALAFENVDVNDQVATYVGDVVGAPVTWAYKPLATAVGHAYTWSVPVVQDVAVKGLWEPVAELGTKPAESIVKIAFWNVWATYVVGDSFWGVLRRSFNDLKK